MLGGWKDSSPGKALAPEKQPHSVKITGRRGARARPIEIKQFDVKPLESPEKESGLQNKCNSARRAIADMVPS